MGVRRGLWLLLLLCACGDEPAEKTSPVPLTGTLPPRPDAMSCRLDGHPPGVLPELTLEEEVVEVSLDDPIALAPVHDGTNDVLVLERDGRVWRVQDLAEATSGELVLTPATHVAEALAMATSSVHPDHVVIALRTTGGIVRVSRFTLSSPIDTASERVILSSSRTATAAVTFDDAGLLYAAFGDSTEDPAESVDAQDPATVEGTVSRVDITPLDGTGSYGVPPDNPSATALGGDGDVSRAWAMGMRSPSACAFGDGSAWCVDRGMTVSEVHQVPFAKDLGWPDHDGSRCLAPGGCSLELERYPQATVERPETSCGLIGIATYAGDRFPSLAPSLIYADSCAGRVHGLLLDPPDDHLWSGPLVDVPGTATGMGSDAHGEVYLLTTSPGGIHRVVSSNESATFPSLLSETGCFTDVPSLTPSPGVIPYDVASPLWSDGSFKERFVEIPPGTTIGVGEGDEPWSYPLGTVIVKTFSYPLDGDPSPSPVEIRVMVLRAHGWEFHTYRYDAAEGDAVLLDDDDARDLNVTTGDGTLALTHGFPSRFSCSICHRVEGARVIGVGTAQLNRIVEYDDGPNHQLKAMEAIGLFTDAARFRDPTTEVALTTPGDPDANVAEQARAYLHANCAHCHRPDGWVPPGLNMDLRYDVAFAQTATCSEPTQSGTPGLLIQPGDATGSRLFERMSTRGNRKMPPLATELVDDTGLAAVRDWITGLTECPE